MLRDRQPTGVSQIIRRERVSLIDACTIKSNANGLTLILDPDVDYETLIREVCAKFAQAKHFFGKTDLILRVEGRQMSGKEIAVLVEAIELNSLVHILLIDEKDELKDVRMAERKDRFYFDMFYQNAKIIPGTLKKDESVESDGSILILGDVKRGASVSARGNVIIVGEVKGSIHAGCDGEKTAYIVANEFDTKDITIAGTSGEVVSQKRGLFNRKAPAEPYAVVLWEGAMLKEPLSNGIIRQVTG